jgi:hypothetical protein
LGLEDELRVGKFDPFTKIDKSLIELLYGHHPDLNHKEFAICRIIADALWDLSGDAIYVEVVARAQNQLSQLFENTEEIEDVIKVLIRKGIVKCKTHSFLFGNNG